VKEFYKKKRYDIHVRMYPEDFDMLMDIAGFFRGWTRKGEVNWMLFEEFMWKLHDKMVVINKKG